jgi:hypothetical protein
MFEVYLMVARGRVQNGVVVLEEGIHFPEGQEVTVIGPPMASTPSLSALPPHSLLDVPVVSLGPVLHTLTADDDLLGEMLDGRR